MHRSFLALAAIVTVAGAAALVPACSNEGEGERCDMRGDNSGKDECQSGLTCTLGTSLPSKPGSDVCCPSDLSAATTPICSRQVGVDAGPPPPDDAEVTDSATDTSPQSDATADAGADVGTDTGTNTGADSSTDAGADSATDGGDAGADAASDV